MRVTPFPGPQLSLQVFIYADDNCHEGRIHHHGQRKWSVESTHAFVSHNVSYALSRLQIIWKLHSLFNHVSRCLEEIMGQRWRGTDQHCRIHAERVVFEFKKLFQELVEAELTRVRRNATSGCHIGPFPKTENSLLLIQNLARTIRIDLARAHSLQVCLYSQSKYEKKSDSRQYLLWVCPLGTMPNALQFLLWTLLQNKGLWIMSQLQTRIGIPRSIFGS